MSCGRGVGAQVSLVRMTARVTVALPAVRVAQQYFRLWAAPVVVGGRSLQADTVAVGSAGTVLTQDYTISDYFAEDFVGTMRTF